MDLKLIFDSTFFIGLTFLGIVVPIFSLSTSFLGHAVEKAKEKAEKRREEAEVELRKEFEDLEKKLKKNRESADRTRDVLEESLKIEGDLAKLKASRYNFKKESAQIIKRYDMLKFKDGVLIPGFLFLCTIIFVLLAKICIVTGYANISWVISLVFLSLGVNRVCQNLSVIQEVALSSDKYQQERMFEAISKAFERQAESEQPVLELSFKEKSFRFSKSSEIKINFKVELTKGKIARNTEILFLVPKEFDFLDVKSRWNQDANYFIPNALTAEIDVGDIRRGVSHTQSITIKTPPKADKYKIGYNLTSEEFTKREFIDVEII